MSIPAFIFTTSFDTNADGTPETIVTDTYSSSGNILESASDNDADGQADALTTYTYDNNGAQTGLFIDSNNDGTIDASFTTDFTVDDSGILTYTETTRNSATDADELAIYKFDSAGNIIEEATGTVGGEIQVNAAYTYNSSGQITVYEQFVSYEPGVLRSEYTYNAAGQIVGSQTPNGDTTYDYDEAGNLIRQESNSQSFGDSVTTYTYDESNRLIASSFSADVPNSPFGGGFSSDQTYEYNAAGQITAYVVSSNSSGRGSGFRYAYEYDAAGNLTKDSSVGTGFNSGISTENTYEYNAAGRMTSYAEASTNSLGGTQRRITEYSYDSAGRFTAQSVDADADGTIDNVTSYAYGADPLSDPAPYDSILDGGVGTEGAVSESSSSMDMDMEADIFFSETAQSVALGTGSEFSGDELVSSSLVESSDLLGTDASLIPTDQFLI